MEIHKKRAQKEFKAKLLKIMEPLFIVLALIIFAFPIFTVLNLSPITKTYSDVLGVDTNKLLKVDLEEVENSISFQPYVTDITDNSFKLTTNIVPLNKGLHDFKGLSIKNISSGYVKLSISGSMESNNMLEIGYISESGEKVLQNSNGSLYIKEILIPAGETVKLNIYIKSPEGTNFSDKLFINISATVYED